MKLFKVQYKKLLSKFIYNTSFDLLDNKHINYSNSLINKFNSYYSKYTPIKSNYFIIKSFPEKELISLFTMECPTPNNENFNTNNREIIEISKKLRRSVKINEKKICFNCSKKSFCKFYEKEAKNDNIYDISLSELNIYLHLLNLIDKKDTVINIDNEDNIDNKSLIDHEDSQINEVKLEKVSKKIKTKYEFNYIPTEKQFYSAKIITDNIINILDDLLNQNGVYFKTLENSIINKRNISEEANHNTHINQNTNLQLDNLNSNDDPRKLMKLYSEANNRKDKKIILAKYNQSMKNLPIQWGKYEKINIAAAKKINNEEEEDKVAIKKNHNDPNSNSKNKDNVKYHNTTILGRKALERTSEIPDLFGVNKINKQININNQKNITFQREVNLSKIVSSDDHSIVKIPGKEVKMALNYIKDNNPDKEEIFKSQLVKSIENMSVNISKEVKESYSKIDLKLQENKERTLEKNKLEKERHLLNHKALLENNSSNKKLIESNIISDEISQALSTFERKLTVANNQEEQSKDNKKYEYNTITSIDDNFSIIKQSSPQRSLLIKAQQKSSQLKKLNSEPSIRKYQANNFYNKNPDTTVQFEKDNDVMRTLKYEKSIKKPNKPIN